MKQWIIIVLLLVVLVIVLLRRTSGLASGTSTCNSCPITTSKYYRNDEACNPNAQDRSCVCETGDCPTGSASAGTTASVGISSCMPTTPCPAGKYAVDGVCTNCPANTYKAAAGNLGLTACLACPAQSSSVAGSSECTCGANYTVTGTGANQTCTYQTCTGRTYAT